MYDATLSQALYGVSYGLLLFMLAAGLTLIFSMMGVLNFAHASFYMLGAYFAYQLSLWLGFWPALVVAPVLLFIIGALVERWGLRRVHKWGHVPELLFTFGLSYIIVELVQVIWGRAAVAYRVPDELDGPVAWLQQMGITFPQYRMFMMAVAIGMLASIWLVLTRTRIGLVGVALVASILATMWLHRYWLDPATQPHPDLRPFSYALPVWWDAFALGMLAALAIAAGRGRLPLARELRYAALVPALAAWAPDGAT